MRSISRQVALMITVIAALLLFRPEAAGATSSAPSKPGSSTPLTFGIGPASPLPSGQTVDGRPYLSYLTSPGGLITDAVLLVNVGTEPVTLHVYATDAIDSSTGDFSLLPSATKPTDAGAWFQLQVPKNGLVTVPARSGSKAGQLKIPVEAHVPLQARPGDHVAGLVASLDTLAKSKTGARIRFEQRIGLRAYVRVSGRLDPNVAVDHLHASHHGGSGLVGRGTTTVSYDVHNTGNVRVNVNQQVNLTGWLSHPRVTYPAALPDMLPGATIHVVQTFPGRFAIGRQRAIVTLFPTPIDPTIPRPSGLHQASIIFWVIPWLLIAIIVGLILLLGFGRWWWKRHKARAAARPAGGGRRAQRTRPEPKRKATVARITVVALIFGLGVLRGAPALADDGSASGGKLMLAGSVTGDPTKAITDGMWGHEGPAHDGATFVMADLSDSTGAVTDASQALWLQRFGITDFNNVGIAFVKASKDGSAERPTVRAGENAGQAFQWFTLSTLASGLRGSTVPYRDGVLTVHTLSSYEDWMQHGRPDQVFDANLVAHDDLAPGTPVSKHPLGTSVQNTWPTGEDISLVAFKYDGFTSDGIPLVSADSAGHAMTAWLTFRTVAGSDNPKVRTSAGYHVLSSSPLPIAPDKVAGGHTSASPSAGGTAAGAAASSASGSSTGAATSSTSPHGGATLAADPTAATTAASHHGSGGGAAWLWIGGGLLVVVAGSIAFALRRRTT